MKSIYLVLFIAFFNIVFAQKAIKNSVSFDYIKLPANPLEEGNRTYKSNVVLEYIDEINEELAKAEEEYQNDLEDYPNVLAKAEKKHEERMERYDQELKDWKEKSLGEKFVEKQFLNENNKPVKPSAFYPPRKPQKRVVEHQVIFKEDLLVKKFLKIDGLTESDNPALQITISLFGFEKSETTSTSKVENKYNSSTKQYEKGTVTTYTTPVRHPIHMKIVNSLGEDLYDVMLEESDFFHDDITTSYPNQTYFQSLEKRIVNSRLHNLWVWLNDQYGYEQRTIKQNIIVPYSKKQDYTDFQSAFFDSSEGYSLLIEDEEQAHIKLQSAIDIWNNALEESNIEDKNARINGKVTEFTLRNLYNAYIYTHQYDNALDISNQLIGPNPNKKELGFAKSRRENIAKLKQRFKANNN